MAIFPGKCSDASSAASFSSTANNTGIGGKGMILPFRKSASMNNQAQFDKQHHEFKLDVAGYADDNVLHPSARSRKRRRDVPLTEVEYRLRLITECWNRHAQKYSNAESVSKQIPKDFLRLDNRRRRRSRLFDITEEPPSFMSMIAAHIDQQQPQDTEPSHLEQDQYENNPSIPSISKLRLYSTSFETQTGPQAIFQSTEVNDDDDGQAQAPSIGAMAVCMSSEVELPDQLNETSYDNEQVPSMGLMVGDRGDSQSGGRNFSYGAPPSHTDVALRDESHNGESGGSQNYL